jgi:hypothetical protein
MHNNSVNKKQIKRNRIVTRVSNFFNRQICKIKKALGLNSPSIGSGVVLSQKEITKKTEER